ncbi:MAG: gamma carbonic anhydrase family protein [Alphaproteobacteria bacterium]|nr:gamma carbonic anhydrase family protein [Alphaproteobacteria bacterium]
MIEALGDLHPRIDPTAWVHASAVVIGEVELGPRVSIWPTAVLRGDMGLIRFGADSNLQDGSVCHNTDGRSETLVGERVTVGHRAILHGCIVEDDCLIGMGAIVMDNARIGAGSFVAGGALVPPGREFPPGSFILGSPAKAVRPCGEREAKAIAYSWKHYAETVARYRP